jgi:hypothetical protein
MEPNANEENNEFNVEYVVSMSSIFLFLLFSLPYK